MRRNEPGRTPPRPSGLVLAVHLALFAATLATTLWAGYGLAPAGGDGGVVDVAARGIPFAGSLLAILLAHEMGHWVVARRHGVDASLPFFIPAPFGVGTFGAMIRLRSPMPSRRAALEIGAAGPLAGLAVALPLLLVGFALSELREVTAGAATPGAASPWALLTSLLAGDAPSAAGGTFLGDSAITWAARWLVHGEAAAGHDIVLHPIGFAAWIGLLVTALNLVPAGQLDGGHVLYALLGQRGAFLASRIVAAALLVAGLLLSWNWLVWWFLTRAVVGLAHPRSAFEAPLDRRSRILAYATLAVFALTVVPVPVSF